MKSNPANTWLFSFGRTAKFLAVRILTYTSFVTT